MKAAIGSRHSTWLSQRSYVHVHACMQMGPSGSGKTTLLDVLAGRKNFGKVGACWHQLACMLVRGVAQQAADWQVGAEVQQAGMDPC